MHRTKPSGSMNYAAVLQLWLLATVLVGCLLMPRPGGAVLLVPLFAHTVSVTGAGSVAVLRAGSIPGSVLVRISGDVPVLGWLRRGVLPLGAPAVLCDPATNSAQVPQKDAVP